MNGRLLVILSLMLVAASPALATFAVVQDVVINSATTCSSTSGTTCAVSFSALGAGHLLTVDIKVSSTTAPSSPVCTSACGTVTECSACQVNDGTRLQSIWYVLSTTAGSTQISFTVANNSGRFIRVIEHSYTLTTVTFDTGNSVSRGAASTMAAPALTLTTGNNYVFTQDVYGAAQLANSIDGSYTIDTSGSSTRHAAYRLNQATYTAPTWTMAGSGAAIVSGAAFYESGAAAAARHRVIGN